MKALATVLVWLLVMPTNALAFVQSENRIKVKNRIGGSESPRRHSAGGQRCYVLIRSGENGSSRVNSHQGTGTTRYLLDGASVLEEFDAANSATARFLNNPDQLDELLAYEKSGALAYPLTDAIGSIYAVADTSGAVVHRYDFDVYGVRADLGGSTLAIDVGYTGRWHDSNGLIEHRDRQRNPRFSQWMQPDRAGFVDGPNTYGYARSNPASWQDPHGLFTQVVASIAAGLVIDAAMQWLDLAMRNECDPDLQDVVALGFTYFGYLLSLGIVATVIGGNVPTIHRACSSRSRTRLRTRRTLCQRWAGSRRCPSTTPSCLRV